VGKNAIKSRIIKTQSKAKTGGERHQTQLKKGEQSPPTVKKLVKTGFHKTHHRQMLRIRGGKGQKKNPGGLPGGSGTENSKRKSKARRGQGKKRVYAPGLKRHRASQVGEKKLTNTGEGTKRLSEEETTRPTNYNKWKNGRA